MVRNALVTKMRLLAKVASRSDEPGGADLDRALDAYLQAHRTTYAQAERLSLTHVFLSADKRGAALEDDAQALLSRLRAAETPPTAAARLGDPFVSGTVFTQDVAERSGEDLRRRARDRRGGTRARHVVGADPLALRAPSRVGRASAMSRPSRRSTPSARACCSAYRAERRAQYLDAHGRRAARGLRGPDRARCADELTHDRGCASRRGRRRAFAVAAALLALVLLSSAHRGRARAVAGAARPSRARRRPRRDHVEGPGAAPHRRGAATDASRPTVRS